MAGRPLHIEGRLVPPGVEVPGAAHWSRLESWVSARRIAAVAPGEPYTSWAQWLKDNPAPEPAQPAQDSAEEPASA